jgi:O-antigen/teichoic acid export membrane protein
MLNVEQFGEAIMSLSFIVIIEGISDTGIVSGYIRCDTSEDENILYSIWVINLIRGALLTVILIVLSHVTHDTFFGLEKKNLTVLAFLPLVRSLLNPEYFSLTKNLEFKKLFFINIFVFSLEILVLIFLLFKECGSVSAILSLIIAESIKIIVSFYLFKFDFVAVFSYKSVKPLFAFSRWLWVQNIIGVVLSQFDKLYIANSLGLSVYGGYQATSRLSQFLISDFSSIWSAYLFPKNSLEKDVKYGILFTGYNLKVITITLGLTVISLIFSGWIINLTIGSNFTMYDDVFKIQSITMFFGAIIAINISLLKSCGRSKLIAFAAFIQLVLLVFLSYIILPIYGLQGVAFVNCFVIFLTAFILSVNSHSTFDGKK